MSGTTEHDVRSTTPTAGPERGGHRHRRRVALAVSALLAAGVVLGACGSEDGDDPASSTTSTTGAASSTTVEAGDTSTSTDSTPTTDPATAQPVLLYFTQGEVVGVGGRELGGVSIARVTLESLMAGPNDVESGLGMDTEIPVGTQVLDIDISDGVATVDLNATFQRGGGSLSMSLRVAQVVFTLTQFDTVDTVDIRIDGSAVDGIGGEGIPASGLDRTDFEDQSPAILVESPTPGSDVSPSFTVSGTSNTFEATYQWAVLDDSDEVLQEDFGTATSGTGTRGTFSFDVDLGGHSGSVTVKVFELSAETGREVNVVEVPITVG